jgi:hypothetical protein
LIYEVFIAPLDLQRDVTRFSTPIVLNYSFLALLADTRLEALVRPLPNLSNIDNLAF